ncbi:DUF961 family protein [Enterococcus thailandicus]|uniref:DUF961 family protein n=1 Tax=Enterococcus thailandicus TaxID=417368 RepID=UPI00094D31DD|nr:DUF961 family protein [Enterococcus thailandicus]MDT2752023.1 DUF961 family protein [Enterococcus thailandicus]MDT2777099.1 DUF961 family protein [Enterococcus thailandicus]GMC04169.1 hypothetical protein K4E_17070 [Enterococcus thailandicus]
MGLNFKDNTIEDIDVKKTFGKMNFLEVEQIFERDADNRVTEIVREQRVTVYSEKLNDQVEIVIAPDYEVKDIDYDDEIELTGHVTARAWLSMYKGYNDSVQSEQAFKIRAAGIKKISTKGILPPVKEKKEN